MTRDEIDVLWQFVAKQATKERRVPLYHFADLIAAAEREACAKVCEEWGAWNNVAQDCAAAIRARGTND